MNPCKTSPDISNGPDGLSVELVVLLKARETVVSNLKMIHQAGLEKVRELEAEIDKLKARK